MEDLRSVISNRVLSTPLLEDKDDDSNDESNRVSLAKEDFLQAQSDPRFFLFSNSSFDFSHLVTNAFVIRRKLPEIGKIVESLIHATFICEPTRRLLYSEETDGHETCWNELERERDPPDIEPSLDVFANADYFWRLA